jgi:hypothetical protein
MKPLLFALTLCCLVSCTTQPAKQSYENIRDNTAPIKITRELIRDSNERLGFETNLPPTQATTEVIQSEVVLQTNLQIFTELFAKNQQLRISQEDILISFRESARRLAFFTSLANQADTNTVQIINHFKDSELYLPNVLDNFSKERSEATTAQFEYQKLLERRMERLELLSAALQGISAVHMQGPQVIKIGGNNNNPVRLRRNGSGNNFVDDHGHNYHYNPSVNSFTTETGEVLNYHGGNRWGK